jgi:hypothetical protein
VKVRTLAIAAVALTIGLVPAAHGMAGARPLTTEPDAYTDVDVTITDTRITLSDNDYERADGVNFHVLNKGKRAHTFAIVGVDTGTITPLGAEGLKTPLLKHNQKYVIQVYLDVRGVFTYRSLARADRAKPGMHGKFTVN